EWPGPVSKLRGHTISLHRVHEEMRSGVHEVTRSHTNYADHRFQLRLSATPSVADPPAAPHAYSAAPTESKRVGQEIDELSPTIVQRGPLRSVAEALDVFGPGSSRTEWDHCFPMKYSSST